ncbi:uncharacterized protein LOC116023590 isoform X2 [Ipomoea triloba]|uniref:uncharacterized protein LOC116023590 isoform X2 n=1 Tax=Ipomoea triloba TaxID=35885 RepID=UPI00125E9B93|nr:uncharacterized protein LOC116023590 isoform X2 [Ipomoea triloba]
MLAVYILVSEVTPLKTSSAMKLRCVRTYEIRDRRTSDEYFMILRCYWQISGDLSAQNRLKFKIGVQRARSHILRGFLL